MALLKDKTWK